MINSITINSARPFIRLISRKCKKDNKYFLTSILDSYFNSESKLCFNCSALGFLSKPFIDLSVSSFGIDKTALEKSFHKDRYLSDAVACAIEGMGDFGFQKNKPAIYLYLMIWNFTNECNYKCKHCYQDAGEKNKNELTLNEKFDVIDQFIKARGRCIVLSGGEPTISKDFEPVVQYAYENNLRILIASNGFRFSDREFTKRVSKFIDGVQISLDSPYRKIHDKFRGFRGSFDIARRAVKNLRKYRVNTAYCYFITKKSIPDVPRFEKFALKDKVGLTVLYDFKNCGRARDIKKMDPSAEEREKLMDSVCLRQSKGYKKEYKVYMVHPRYTIKTIEHKMPQLTHLASLDLSKSFLNINFAANFLAGCGAGFNQLDVQPDGTLIPCTHMPVSLGNIRDTTIKKVWHSHPYLKRLRNREELKGLCGTCEGRYMCGGCRAIAYGYTGDFMESDPSCILVKNQDK